MDYSVVPFQLLIFASPNDSVPQGQSNVSQYAFAFDKYSTSDNHLQAMIDTQFLTIGLYYTIGHSRNKQ